MCSVFDLQRFGDWYSTCGITNLPIKSGDRTVALILRQNVEDLTGNCLEDTQSVFSLVTIPIKGVANCYGSLEIVDDNPVVEKHLQTILNNTKSLKDNYNEFIENTVHGYAIEYFHEQAYLGLAVYYGHELCKSYSDYYRSVLDNLSRYMTCYNYRQLDYVYNQVATYPYVVNELVNLILVDQAFLRCRRFWSPQIGTQQENDSLSIFVGSLIARLVDAESD